MSTYSVFEAGAPAEWLRGEFPHPAFKRAVRGKQFLAEQLGLTGMELSLNSLPPGFAVPFLHRHRAHEELYLFLSGQGEVQVDGDVIPVRAGSAVRIAPEGARTWRNTGEESLVYVVIQARAGSLASRTIGDGQPLDTPPVWAPMTVAL